MIARVFAVLELVSQSHHRLQLVKQNKTKSNLNMNMIQLSIS